MWQDAAVFFLWRGIGGFVMAILYAIGNLLYCIVQRYNRPKLIKIYECLNLKEKGQGGELVMKILILSCNTGQGHNSCAQAIKEHFCEKDIECEICDVFQIVSVGISHFLAWGHSFMYRYIPRLFRYGYNYSKKHNFGNVHFENN